MIRRKTGISNRQKAAAPTALSGKFDCFAASGPPPPPTACRFFTVDNFNTLLRAERESCRYRASNWRRDGFEQSREIFHYVIIPEADHAVAAMRKLCRADRIFLLEHSVLAAAELDRELPAGQAKSTM
jgi:hypothetical protein